MLSLPLVRPATSEVRPREPAHMAKRAPTDLLLVRSGRTDWEDQGRLQGNADLPLGEPGRKSLSAILDHLHRDDDQPAPAAVIAAPDEASQETARLLAERSGAKVRTIDNLRAIHLGLWEGLLDEDLNDRYARAYRQWRDDPASINPPEGEGFIAGQVRVLTALAKALEKAAGPVAVVLRPLEYALVRAATQNQPSSKIWRLLEDGPLTERLTLEPGALRAVLEQISARA